MSYFDDPLQANFQADFGFDAPHKTKTKCKNPVFSSPYLHRIAIMKDYHCGDKGDSDPGGLKGWVTSSICTGCGKEYKKNNKFFYPDEK